MNRNPLFIAHYPHTKTLCYKVSCPWTKYREHTIVLCEAHEGIEKARKLAFKALQAELKNALEQPIGNE